MAEGVNQLLLTALIGIYVWLPYCSAARDRMKALPLIGSILTEALELIEASAEQ